MLLLFIFGLSSNEVFSSSVDECGGSWHQFRSSSHSCFQVNIDIVIHINAESHCESQHGSLVMFTSNEEVEYCLRLLAQDSTTSKGVYIGYWFDSKNNSFQPAYSMLKNGIAFLKNGTLIMATALRDYAHIGNDCVLMKVNLTKGRILPSFEAVRCDFPAPFICKKYPIKSKCVSIHDVEVGNNEIFTPKPDNSFGIYPKNAYCTNCTCRNGKAVNCVKETCRSPPTNCVNPYMKEGTCCKYDCPLSSPPNPKQNDFGVSTQVRVVITVVTGLFIVLLLIILFVRLKWAHTDFTPSLSCIRRFISRNRRSSSRLEEEAPEEADEVQEIDGGFYAIIGEPPPSYNDIVTRLYDSLQSVNSAGEAPPSYASALTPMQIAAALQTNMQYPGITGAVLVGRAMPRGSVDLESLSIISDDAFEQDPYGEHTPLAGSISEIRSSSIRRPRFRRPYQTRSTHASGNTTRTRHSAGDGTRRRNWSGDCSFRTRPPPRLRARHQSADPRNNQLHESFEIASTSQGVLPRCTSSPKAFSSLENLACSSGTINPTFEDDGTRHETNC